MKKLYILKLIFVLLLPVIFFITESKACVDYHPTPPPLTVRIDSSWTKMEIRVHQLNIFAGSTGAFCTCGLAGYDQLFDLIYYVAFVDSGTNNPVYGFDVWNANTNSTNAWSAQEPTYNWNGFVAEVINNMLPNSPVELLIKTDLPPGYSSTADVDSSLAFSGFGTDEWNNQTNTLVFSHYSFSGFGPASYELVSATYFTSVEENENNAYFNIYPNPGNGVIYISSAYTESMLLEIFDIAGEIRKEFLITSGKTELDLRFLSKGIYLIRVKNNKEAIFTRKIIITI